MDMLIAATMIDLCADMRHQCGSKNRPRRSKKTTTEDPQPKPSKKERRRQNCAIYRARLKADPVRYAEFCRKNILLKRMARKNATPEKKLAEREKARLRQAAYRERQKAKSKAAQPDDPSRPIASKPPKTRAKPPETRAKPPETRAKPPKTRAKPPKTRAKPPETRADVKAKELRRMKNRLYQQKRRANMSAQKKHQEREHNRVYAINKRSREKAALTNGITVNGNDAA